MTEVQPSTGSPGSSSGSRRWSNVATSTSHKLRDSCHACAASKVKCSKEKPTCSRCVKRGTACEYLVTKRPGRKHDSRTAYRNPPRVDSEQALAEFSWSTTLPRLSSGKSTPRDVAQHSPTSGESTLGVSSDIFQSFLSPVDASFPMDVNFDDVFAPPLIFPGQDLPEFDILNTSNVFSSSESSNSTGYGSSATDSSVAHSSTEDTIFLFGQGNASSRHQPVSNFSTLLDESFPISASMTNKSSQVTGTKPNPINQTRQRHGSQASCLSCGCLIRALDLLKRLLADNSLPRTEETTKDGQLGNFHAVKAMNKRTIEALAQILKCSCSADSYLLTIASLIVFKILNWYAVVARTSISATFSSCEDPLEDTDALSLLSSNFSRRSNNQIPAVTEISNSIDGEDAGRIVAQLVLGELHLVQCLVNQLVLKLKACLPHAAPETRDAVKDPTTFAGNDLSLAFSTPMLHQMEPELRRRTSSLASEIIGMLQQE